MLDLTPARSMEARGSLNARGRYASPAVADAAAGRREDATAAHLGQRAAVLTRRGMYWVQDSGEHLRLELSRATDRAAGRVRKAPLRSALLALACGALVFVLVSRLGKGSD